MSIEITDDGLRRITVARELPTDQASAWEAIASGPGISAWFFPATLTPEVGGEITVTFQPEMIARSTITAWAPPGRFTAEDPTWLPGAPTLYTEWTARALADGRSEVRVTHHMETTEETWDSMLRDIVIGWNGFFDNLEKHVAKT